MAYMLYPKLGETAYPERQIQVETWFNPTLKIKTRKVKENIFIYDVLTLNQILRNTNQANSNLVPEKHRSTIGILFDNLHPFKKDGRLIQEFPAYLHEPEYFRYDFW